MKLVLLCTGVMMIVLDTTIVTVALPSMQTDLHLSNTSLTWVLNAYLLSYGGFLLVSGRLGDLYGQRRLFLVGIAIFAIASLVCGLAASAWVMLAARAVQGLGGAVVSAVSLALIMNLFTEASARARALGFYGFVCAAGGCLGELLGGVLTGALGWHWIFLVNVPVGVAVYVASLFYLPCDSATVRVQQSEARLQQPLIPLRLFESRNFTIASVIGVLWTAGTFTWFVVSALYLQQVLSYDPFRVGLAFLPAQLIMALFSGGLSAKVVMRFGILRPLWLGLLLATAGLLLFARAPVRGAFVVDVLPCMLLLGLGAGLMSTPLLLAAMNDVGSEDSGLASGIVNTAFLMGGALGLAVLASVAEIRTDLLLQSGGGSLVALNGGYQFAFLAAAVLTAIGAALGAFRLAPDVDAQNRHPHFAPRRGR